MTSGLYRITLVARHLTETRVEQASQRLQSWGVDLHESRWLGPNEAWCTEATLGNISALSLANSLREALPRSDVAVTPLTLNPDGRPLSDTKKLLCADMDATIVEGESLDEVAARLDLGPEIAALTERAMRGELGFAEALIERVAMLKGVSIELFDAVAEALIPSPGAQTLIATMRSRGARCLLISGGFERIATRVASALGFDAAVANRLVLREGRLSGGLYLPLVDGARKAALLQAEAEALGIDARESLAIGDGANDLDMIQAAGLGIAYQGKPRLKAATAQQINHSELTTALYFQGIARADWETG